jgi:hypothetical protein
MNRKQLGRPVPETSRAERPVPHMRQPLSLSKVELGQFVFLNVGIDADPALHRGSQFGYRQPTFEGSLDTFKFPLHHGSPMHADKTPLEHPLERPLPSCHFSAILF